MPQLLPKALWESTSKASQLVACGVRKSATEDRIRRTKTFGARRDESRRIAAVLELAAAGFGVTCVLSQIGVRLVSIYAVIGTGI